LALGADLVDSNDGSDWNKSDSDPDRCCFWGEDVGVVVVVVLVVLFALALLKALVVVALALAVGVLGVLGPVFLALGDSPCNVLVAVAVAVVAVASFELVLDRNFDDNNKFGSDIYNGFLTGAGVLLVEFNVSLDSPWPKKSSMQRSSCCCS